MNDNEKKTLKFSVIDNTTGNCPDLYNIALKEDWAKGLMYCDMDGFAINEDGNLVLLDECGNVAYCPEDRFTVVFEDSVVISKEDYEELTNSEIGELVKENKELEEQCVKWMDMFHKKKEQAKQERQETAEKILKKIFQIGCGGKWLADLCKEYGVELGEK